MPYRTLNSLICLTSKAAAFCLGAALLSVPAHAQPLWERVGPLPLQTDYPSKRYQNQLAFDSTRGHTVLFGGYDFNSELGPIHFDDTWIWDGESWTKVPVFGPAPRRNAAMAYDPVRDEIVMFGGMFSWEEDYTTFNNYLSDTWIWDGSTWAPRAAEGPSARSGATMVFDHHRGEMILFGGSCLGDAGFEYKGDTWAWDGEAWTLRSDSGPPPRVSHVMVYHSKTQETILFGGYSRIDDVGQFFGDTWAWDGSGWTLRSRSGPSPRIRSLFVDLKPHGELLLRGGGSNFTGNYQYFDDSWAWDGSSWAKVSHSEGPSRRLTNGTYDTMRNQVLLFGGLASAGFVKNDTWLLYTGCSRADFNLDNVVDTGDISAFISLFINADPQVDMNRDGYIDVGDIGLFVDFFLMGC